MSTSQWILSLSLLAWALVRNMGTRPVSRGTFVLPLVIVGAAVAGFLVPLPTSGNDLGLVVVFGAIGTAFGVAAAAVTRLEHRDGVLTATAGVAFALLWVALIGARIAFAQWATGPGSTTIGLFSRDHLITGADAWTAAFVVMALGMVLARTVVLAARAYRLTTAAAVSATA